MTQSVNRWPSKTSAENTANRTSGELQLFSASRLLERSGHGVNSAVTDLLNVQVKDNGKEIVVTK